MLLKPFSLSVSLGGLQHQQRPLYCLHWHRLWCVKGNQFDSKGRSSQAVLRESVYKSSSVIKGIVYGGMYGLWCSLKIWLCFPKNFGGVRAWVFLPGVMRPHQALLPGNWEANREAANLEPLSNNEAAQMCKVILVTLYYPCVQVAVVELCFPQ